MNAKIKVLGYWAFLLILSHNVKAQQIITIDKAIDMALKNSPGIKAGESQIKEADAKYTQAYSTFLPQADVMSKYYYSNNLPGMYPLAGTSVPVLNNGIPTGENIIMHPMAPYPDLARDVMTTDFNVTYPIYAGNKRKNALSSTMDLRKAYEQDLNDIKAQTVLNVKTVFYNILFLNELIKVYQESLDQMNEHLALAEKAFTEGVRSEFDVLSFKNKIEEFKSKIIEIEGNRDVAILGLKNLMNMPDSSNITCTGRLSSDTLLLELLKYKNTDSIIHNNFKIQYLKSMMQVLDKKAKIEGAENLPVLFAFGNYHIYHGMDFPPFDANWRQGYAVGVGLKINLFDGNLSKGKVAEIKAGIEKLNYYQEGLSLKLNYDLQKSFKNIESLTAQKVSAESNLEVARKAYEIAKIAYKNGVITNIELNDAQLNINRSEILILNVEKSILIELANIEYLNGIIK
jgi:outer membrane protein TolC